MTGKMKNSKWLIIGFGSLGFMALLFMIVMFSNSNIWGRASNESDSKAYNQSFKYCSP